MGAIWIGFGLRLYTSNDLYPDVKMPLEYVPLHGRAMFWILPGLVAMVLCFRRGPRWVKWGYVSLVLPVAARSLSYAGGVVIELRNWLEGVEPTPEFRMIADTLIWVGIALLVLILSNWSDSEGQGNEH